LECAASRWPNAGLGRQAILEEEDTRKFLAFCVRICSDDIEKRRREEIYAEWALKRLGP